MGESDREELVGSLKQIIYDIKNACVDICGRSLTPGPDCALVEEYSGHSPQKHT